ncbi:hypothetical protein Ancab_032662 [Ancistrocladus abbreviatus]
MDIEEQLKLLNKPAVKTIQTEYGDIYDCIDFYKQPAFDHPLLKNHSFYPEMKPSFIDDKRASAKLLPPEMEISVLKLKDGGCPKGTVPIRRVSKDDLMRMKLHSKQYDSPINLDYPKPNAGNHKRAKSAIYNGVYGRLSIYNCHVGAFEYTSGEVIIQNGRENIKAGWMVNPTLYKDNRTHRFIYTNSRGSHCFNILCSGFVAVRHDIPVDVAYDGPVSTRGQRSAVDDYIILKDKVTGNWWLEAGQDHIQIGFWPKQLFQELAQQASFIACGGEVYSPNQSYPPMGSGFFPIKNTFYDAFCANFDIIDQEYQFVRVEHAQEFADSSAYRVQDIERTRLGHLVLYGGPNK